MTSRGLTEEDFEQVAGFLHEVLQVRMGIGAPRTISNVGDLLTC
jgi:hypothetical protein